MAHMMRRLAVDKTNADLILFSDGYVYRFVGTQNRGWLCSYEVWERTFRHSPQFTLINTPPRSKAEAAYRFAEALNRGL